MENHPYIDVHSHILPSVDDGSRSMSQTMDMLQLAYGQGIGKIIATPHYDCNGKNATVEKLLQIKQEVEEEIHKENMDVEIFLGNELYYGPGILEDLKSGKALTLAGSKYVLVEFSVGETYQRIYQAFRELVLAGYAPILAHMERYVSLEGREDRLEELIQLGVYMQMNGKSLLGGFLDRKAASCRKLVQEGWIHLIGSDTHDEKYRPPLMEDVQNKLAKKLDSPSIHTLFMENPEKILLGKYI